MRTTLSQWRIHAGGGRWGRPPSKRARKIFLNESEKQIQRQKANFYILVFAETLLTLHRMHYADTSSPPSSHIARTSASATEADSPRVTSVICTRARGYPPSRRTSSPFDQYQFILLGDRVTCVCEQIAQGCCLKAERPGF